jgi:hypothetical protein
MNMAATTEKPAELNHATGMGNKILFPGAGQWELRAASVSSSPVLERAEQLPDLAAKLNGNSMMAIPMHHVTVLPLWLATEDSSLIEEMLWLQLEKRGLLAGSRTETTVDYRVLRRMQGRSLLTVQVLARDFPDEWCFGKPSKYISASDCLALPKNHIVLWRELGRLVLAFASDGELLYVQTLPGELDVKELALEIRCARLQLASEQVFEKPGGLVVWDDDKKLDFTRLGRELELPLQIADEPPFSLSSKPRILTPYLVRQQQRERNRRRRGLKILGSIGILYLLFVALLLGDFGRLWWQKHGMEKDLALHRTAVQSIRSTALRWQALEPAILPEIYPIEMLFRCSRMLPEDGVRLIKFDQVGQRVLMTGEARNAPAAYKFVDDLKNSKDLAAYSWDMPPPKLLPNNSAQFQIEGKSRYAGANSQ